MSGYLKTVAFAKLGVYRAGRVYCSLPSRRFKGSRISFLTIGGRKITPTSEAKWVFEKRQVVKWVFEKSH